MTGLIGKWIEGTFTAVFIYLVLVNANGFATVMQAITQFYTQSVKTLQGR